MAGDGQVADGVNFHRHGIGQGADARAAHRIGGQEARAAGFIKVFQDGQRLGQRQPVDIERGHKALRIAREVRRAALFAGLKVHRNRRPVLPQQPQCDAQPVGRR